MVPFRTWKLVGATPEEDGQSEQHPAESGQSLLTAEQFTESKASEMPLKGLNHACFSTDMADQDAGFSRKVVAFLGRAS